ncbi:hypothetical protein M0R79_05210 [Ignavigranum ruoffiae]|uniref:hypothetical protein n=1 Tax=Ignavigranum ruoffiae TaxID=89093 RepID=UPI00205C4DC1|nr:hypothetical protein [Ignavigranum ruoffiae]UPQ85077.1 hypothetical protein M0R79_05210 [Ignavigranum ruoffiae]
MRNQHTTVPKVHFLISPTETHKYTLKPSVSRTSFQRDHQLINHLQEHPWLWWIVILVGMPLASLLAVATMTSLFSLFFVFFDSLS